MELTKSYKLEKKADLYRFFYALNSAKTSHVLIRLQIKASLKLLY